MIESFNPEYHGTRLCYWLGHKWVWDEYQHTFCERCEFPDQCEDYYPTYNLPRRIENWLWRFRWYARLWHWWRYERPRMWSWCDDQECMERYGMPEKFFGTTIADHSKCERIPF